MIGHSGRCGYLARTLLVNIEPVTLGLRRVGRENVTGILHIVKVTREQQRSPAVMWLPARPLTIDRGQISPKEHKLVEDCTKSPWCRDMTLTTI
jgi:hypothetical protein